jgi:hypothetical protein
MSHFRNGSQCVAKGTKVLVTGKEKPGNFPLEIEKIKCVFTEELIKDENGKKKHHYSRNPAYDEYAHMIVNLSGGLSTPLFRYQYEFRKGEHESLYEITVAAPDGGTHTLVATEWHPIMASATQVTVAALLSVNDDPDDDNDQVLLREGNQNVYGKVTEVKKVEQTTVVGLALGKVPLAGKARERRLIQLEKALNNEERYWRKDGLRPVENIIFTESIASGTLALQHQLRKQLSWGIKLSTIKDEDESLPKVA